MARHGAGDRRLGPLDRRVANRLVLRGERVAGVGVRQLRHRDDVAGDGLGHRLLRRAAHRHQPVEVLRRAVGGVDQVRVGGHRAGQHPAHRDLAHVLVGDRLEDEREPHRRTDRAARPPRRRRPGRVCGGPSRGDGPIWQIRSASRSTPTPVNAEPHSTGKTERIGDAVRQRPLQLLGARLLSVEVVLQQLVVGHEDRLDERVVRLVLGVGQLVGHAVVVDQIAVVVVGRIVLEIDDAVEPRRPVPMGSSRSDTPGTEPVADLVDGAVEVGAVGVELVDEDRGEACCRRGGEAPERLRADPDPVGRADHEHGQVGDVERGAGLPLEVEVAGCVDQVEAMALVVDLHDRREDRHAVRLLLGLAVADRRAVLDPARPARWHRCGAAARRPAWSCRTRRGRRGRRCGSSRSGHRIRHPGARSTIRPRGYTRLSR